MKKKIFHSLKFVFLIFILILILLPEKESSFSENNKYIQNPHLISGKDVLRIAIPKRKNILNPLNDGGSEVSLLSELLNISLFEKSDKNEFVPSLVESYWYDNDGKTISMILKKGIKFNNGKEVTAEHVKNTYSILANKHYGGTYSRFVDNLEGYYPYKLGKIENLKGVEQVDDYYIKFHFNIADFSNINTLSFPILNIDDGFEIEKVLNFDFANGAGRYELKSSTKDRASLILKKEKENSGIKIKKIDIYFVSPEEVISLYEKGDIDIVYNFTDAHLFSDKHKGRMNEYSYSIDYQSSHYHLLGFNSKSELFNKPEYRRALRDSIDIRKILETKYGKDIFDFPQFPLYKHSKFNDVYRNIDKGITLKELIFKNILLGNLKNISKDNPYRLKIICLDTDRFFKDIETEFIKQLENEYLKVEIIYLKSQDMYKALDGDLKFDIFISKRDMTEMPNLVLEDRYPVEGEYNLFRLTQKSFYYIFEKIKNDYNGEYFKNIKNNWHDNFEKLAPYVVLGTENITNIINNRVKNIYINEFIGIGNIINLRNINLVND